jgi:hypothetical protein
VQTISDSIFYSSGNKDIQSVFFFSSLHIIMWVTPDFFSSRLHGFVFIRCIGHFPLTYLSKLSKCHNETFVMISFAGILSITSFHIMT